MREMKLTLPTGNTDLIAAHAYVKVALMKNFGGYTRTEGLGNWIDGAGAEHPEPVAIYTVAALVASGGWPTFRSIALQAGRLGKQKAIYVVDQQGNAHIVDLVDVGKAMIQEDARVLGVESATGRRLPQVGDFWETCDGSKVRITGDSQSTGYLYVDGVGFTVSYAVTRDGNYVTINSDYEVTVHPLNLKRFIGR